MKRFQFLFAEAGDAGTGGGGTLIPAAAPVANPSAPAADSPWIGSDGSFSPDWHQKALPEPLRDNPSLRVFNNFGDMAQSYVALKGMVGKKLEAPAADATPEQLAQWRKTVGAPDTPENYYTGDVKSYRPESVPEEAWSADGEKAFLAIAHKHHLPPAAVKDILDHYGNSLGAELTASVEAEKAALAGEMTSLRKAWGGEFDANLATAERAARSVGLNPAEHPIFTSAEVVQAFAKMGKLISEDKLVAGAPGTVTGGIEARIREMQDPKSQALLAREYRGEMGAERQAAAQKQLHDLYASRK